MEVIDRIPAELYKILKDDAVTVLHSICQQIWKTQQWPQDWERSVFIPIPKKVNAKECSNYHTVALISHASKVMIKSLTRLDIEGTHLKTVKAIHDKPTVNTILSGEKLKVFLLTSGMRQGCSLSSLSFNILEENLAMAYQ